MTKPEFHKPLTWNIGPDGHTLPFTRRQLHLVYCNPHSWATYTHIIIGRNQFRIKKRDVRKATSERFLKAIFVSPDPNSTDPDDTIQEDRYGELQQIVKVSAMGEEHIILRVLWYPDSACLVDELTKNIYILRQTASNMEESFISASSVHTQVAIVPVPFTPARLYKYNHVKINALASNPNARSRLLNRKDSLLAVFDKTADFFGDIDDEDD